MQWLLNIIYAGVLTCLSPLILGRMLRHGRYRRGLPQKLFGSLPVTTGSNPIVWFHAVSVGEVLQLQKVVAEFRNADRHCSQILITTSTDTGYDLAVERFSDCTVSWFPLDFSWSVNRALDRVRPELVVLTELEFWPGFLNACRRRSIKTAVINARMSDRSFRGYQRIEFLLKPLFRRFSAVAVQSGASAERLMALGVRPECTTVTGSIKFDGVTTDRSNKATSALRSLFNISNEDTVLVAGSTQSPEENMVINAWRELRIEHPRLRLIVVPRHRERFDSVATLLDGERVKHVRRSSLVSASQAIPNDAAILLDTIGELGACWGLADIAFVGGTFGTRGGQNMLEPAAYGAAVLFGPNTWNFRDIVRLLLSEEAAVEVSSTNEFAAHLGQLLDDNSRRRELGEAARRLVLEQQGAIRQTIQLLTTAINSGDTTSRRSAA